MPMPSSCAQAFRIGLLLRLLGQTMVLNLDVVVLAEQVAVPHQALPGLVLPALQQQLLHLAAQAPGKGDDALVVLLQQLVVDARLVVVALGVAPAAQAAQVLVALEIPGEQREVKDALLAAHARLLVAPRAVARHHVGLVAQNRLDPRRLRVVIEVHRAVHVAVVGHGARSVLTLGRDLFHPFEQVLEFGRAVQQRVLGVLVQVREAAAVALFRRAARTVRQMNVRPGRGNRVRVGGHVQSIGRAAPCCP